jgi:hypothetical protein
MADFDCVGWAGSIATDVWKWTLLKIISDTQFAFYYNNITFLTAIII